MKKAAVILLILIGFARISFANVQFQDSSEVYEYWAKRGVIEVVYAYMKDYESVQGILNEKEVLGKQEYHAKFISDIKSDSFTVVKEKFNDVSSFLKDSKYDWKGCEKTIFQPLKKQVDNRVEISLFFSLTKKDKNGEDIPINYIQGKNGENLNPGQNWNNIVNKITKKYNNSLDLLRDEDAGKSKVEVSSRKNEVQVNVENQKVNQRLSQSDIKNQWFKIVVAGCIFIIGVILGSLLFLFFIKTKIRTILRQENGHDYEYYLNSANDSSHSFGFLNVIELLFKGGIEYEKYAKEDRKIRMFNKELEKENKQLKSKVKTLYSEVDELSLVASKNKSNFSKKDETVSSVTKTLEWSVESKPKDRLYFSMPENNGSFNISNGSISNDGKKYFKIEFEKSTTIGELFFLSGERDQKAINRLESYLKPVCDIENITNASTSTRIELIHTGKVSLINDSWLIDPNHKVKIKLY